MNKCGDCLYFGMCSHYVDAEETFPEIDGGCHTFKRKDAFVEVVRCKDCKHYRNPPHGLCYAWTEPCTNERGYKGEVHCVEPDDFCSYGERKE